MPPSKHEVTNEAVKMRRVRNHNQHSNNPGVMFASGMESLIRNQMHQPSKYDQEDLKIMARKANKKEVKESLFSSLCKQILWGKPVKSA